jgi:transposase
MHPTAPVEAADGIRRAPPLHLYHRINKHRDGIIAGVTHGLSNGLTESVNTKLRLLTRIAYGFRSTDNLIALCLLDRGGHCPSLPGRTAAA